MATPWTVHFTRNHQRISNVVHTFAENREQEGQTAWTRRLAVARAHFREYSVQRGGGKTPYLFSWETAKIEHNEQSEYAEFFMQGIMFLSPHRASGRLNLCLNSTPSCRRNCLKSAGRLAMDSSQRAQKIRTEFLADHPAQFFTVMLGEMEAGRKRAWKMNMKLVLRLNGLSDVQWHEWFDLSAHFPTVQFSEYTKEEDAVDTRTNEYTILSYSERYTEDQVRVMKRNVAVVFDGGLPETWAGKPVIDGDLHDFRFLDPRGVIVGLRAKGDAIGGSARGERFIVEGVK
jgi:hypothetical protein